MNIKETLNDLLRKIEDKQRPKDLPPIVPDCGWNHGEETKPKLEKPKSMKLTTL
jgi:hypothetical protein